MGLGALGWGWGGQAKELVEQLGDVLIGQLTRWQGVLQRRLEREKERRELL